MGYFEKTITFPVHAICFHEIDHDKWCIFKSVPQTENGLERGFVKHSLNSVYINWPLRFKSYRLVCLSFAWIYDIHQGACSNEPFLLHINVPWCDRQHGWRRGETLVVVHLPSP